jgi:hypothetical protein
MLMAASDDLLPPDLGTLGHAELLAMVDAAERIAECHRGLAAEGRSILAETLDHGDVFYEWAHYPRGGVLDQASHAQFFYHAHPRNARHATGLAEEHGHFHTFLRPGGVPRGVTPLLLPELALPPSQDHAGGVDPGAHQLPGNMAGTSHLMAISMNAGGLPIRLFTTNRWVTGETWYRAEDVMRMLDRFVLDQAASAPHLNRWLTALFRLFRPQMLQALQQRDATVMAWRRRRRSKSHVFEDRRLDVTSSIAIDLDLQWRAVQTALQRWRR